MRHLPIKHLLLEENNPTCKFNVEVEIEYKKFLKQVFPESGIQGYLYNQFLAKLRVHLLREGVTNYPTRIVKYGNLQELLEGLEITINPKER